MPQLFSLLQSDSPPATVVPPTTLKCRETFIFARQAGIMSSAQPNEADKNIEIWKVKKLIKRLEAARGNGTSMISLIIPPKDQVSRAARMLAEEFVCHPPFWILFLLTRQRNRAPLQTSSLG